jgi:hypothetical protein
MDMDRDLDQIGAGVSQLKNIAVAMKDELNVQAAMVKKNHKCCLF